VAVKAPFDNIDFLTISDKTGEPLYYQNFNMIVYEIGKDEKGNYYRIENSYFIKLLLSSFFCKTRRSF
jgi:hypothetical protein